MTLRVVLDTNVLISGIFFSGPPARILQAWREARFELLLSRPILEEYQRVTDVLNRKFPSVDASKIIRLIAIHSRMIDTEGVSIVVSQDPDDDKFIECAIAGQADVIVSGDKHLLEIEEFEDIQILAPREFLDRFLQNP